MWPPVLEGQIERRLLINYRVDPDRAADLLPAPFRPQVVNGFAVAGICLIRLAALRPKGLPRWVGLRSENAAHRIAVEWDGAGGTRTGVYIPRRDTDALTNVVVGGRLFPGLHERARFAVVHNGPRLHVSFAALDASAAVDAAVTITDELRGSALFDGVEDASTFFEHGSIGYSPTRDVDSIDGLELRTRAWSVRPAVVDFARSSLFDDRDLFPEGTVALDCALVMLDVPVEWHPVQRMASPVERGGVAGPELR